MPLAIILGLILALMRLSRHKIFAWPASIYIEMIRGTPLLVQMYLVYFSLPQLGQALGTDLLTLPISPCLNWGRPWGPIYLRCPTSPSE
jgi:His/Glu/Gln/Arg/opine family amino acid ABC transporter permease subunit